MNKHTLSPLVAATVAALVASAATVGLMSLKGRDGAASPSPVAWSSGAGTEAALAVQPPASAPSPQVPVAPRNPHGIVPVAAPNFRAIVQQFGPAVVHVTVEGTQRNARGELPPGFEDDPFFQFFRGLPHGRGRGGGEMPFRGQGSGFIVSTDGLILTNAHVVRDAKEVSVKLQDRREFRAKVLGLDAMTDVAVLRIEARGLPTVQLGRPDDVQVGDPVLAIGAPFGLEQTATQGIVSAKGRSLPSDTAVPFIQTDAAVNPGNSGGPLFDAAGNVIGINTQIYSQTGGYQGLSFAVPIDVALKIKDQIVQHGRARHARLGVQVQDLNQTLAESFGLQRPDGALVAGVAPGSAAAKAGLKSGDVILSVNGQPIVQAGQLSSRIALSAPGERVTLKVWRDKAARELQATLGSAEPEREQRAAGDEPDDGTRLGLALRPLEPAEKRRAKLEHGLVVEEAEGAAARAGVSPGDVVLAVNGQPVDSVEQLRAVLKSKPKNVALLVERRGERLFVPIRLG